MQTDSTIPVLERLFLWLSLHLCTSIRLGLDIFSGASGRDERSHCVAWCLLTKNKKGSATSNPFPLNQTNQFSVIICVL